MKNFVLGTFTGYVLGIAYTISVFVYLGKRTEKRLALEWAGRLEHSSAGKERTP